MNKKIIIYTGFFLPYLGGVERYTDKLSTELHKLGFDVIIVTSKHDEKLQSFEKRDLYTIYRLPIRNIFKNRYPIFIKNKEYKKQIENIQKENADFVIVNTRFHLTSLIGAKLAKKQNKPVFLIEHGTNHFTVNNKILDWLGHIYEHMLTNKVKKYVDRYYGVSKACNKWLEHFNIQASGVIYNCINTNDGNIEKSKTYNEKYSKNEIIISCAGRLIKEKGILNLVQAFLILKEKHNNIRLVIAGDGDLLPELQNKYKDDKIDLLGKIEFKDIMSLYERTDIFVHPSLYPEGLPTVILEAGLMECAIIATPRGGTIEVIIDDEYGLVIEGTIDSLKKALEKLINSSEDRKIMAENLKNRIKNNFNWEKMALFVSDELKKMEENR